MQVARNTTRFGSSENHASDAAEPPVVSGSNAS